jgi:GNAT superfamily N-acetyltransferase
MRTVIIDNNITNSDWTKANAFDFPDVKTVEDFENSFNIPKEEPARSEKLARLAVLPWVRVAPAPVRELLEGFQKQSLVKLLKASFGGDRSEAGRYAANVRWQGHTKKDISQKVTIGFKSRGAEGGTVWATDKETGRVIGALSFDGYFISKVYVRPEHQRKGVASYLYKEAKKRNGGVEMRADDYTVSGAGFMSAMTGRDVFQSGDYSSAGRLWETWLNELEKETIEKASFGGDRSEAGRYAANIRWQGNVKKEPKGSKFTSKKDDEKFAKKHGNERPVGDGDCFQSAVKVMFDVLSSEDRKKAKICQGVPMGQGQIAGIRFDHAWVEVTRKTDFGDADPNDPQVKFMMERFPTQVIVYDYSNGKELQLPRELYYAIGQIDGDDVRRFSAEEAQTEMIEKGFYGPWE